MFVSAFKLEKGVRDSRFDVRGEDRLVVTLTCRSIREADYGKFRDRPRLHRPFAFIISTVLLPICTVENCYNILLYLATY